MLHRIESVIYANGISRKDVLLSDAVDHLVKTVARYKDVPMLIVIPRIITFGMDANGFEVLLLLLKMMNKQLCIEVVDNFGMPLVDMSREYEKMCTEPLSLGNYSTHVRPLLSLTNLPEQDAILRTASSKIQTWTNDGISLDERQRIIHACQLGSESKDIDKRELRRKVLLIIRDLENITSDNMNQYLEKAKTIVIRELGDLLYCPNKKTHNVIVVRSSSRLTVETTRRLQLGNADIEDNDEDNDYGDYDDEEEDVDKEDDEEELSSEDLDLHIDIDLPMQQFARTSATIEHIDTDTTRQLCIFNGKCETRRQISGVYLELIYFLIYRNVMHLCIDQTTRVSNGLPKFVIVMALCDFRQINLAIASQIGIPPMSIAEADQLRVSHMEAKLNRFCATFRENSNKDSESFQLMKRLALKEHRQSSTPSLLHQYMIELDEKARQNRAVRVSFLSRVDELKAYKMEHGHLNVRSNEDMSLYNFCYKVRRS
jgi:hypothetical protein